MIKKGVQDHKIRRGCVDQIFLLNPIGERAREKKRRMYVRFMDLEKAYNKDNMEALWEVLRMYDVGDKLLNGTNGM